MKSSYILLLMLTCGSVTLFSNASRPASPSLNAASSSTVDPCSEPLLLTHKQIILKSSLADRIDPMLQSTLAQRFDIAKKIKKLAPSATSNELQYYVIDEIMERIKQEMNKLRGQDASDKNWYEGLGCSFSEKITNIRYQIYKDHLYYEQGKLNEQCKMQ